MGGILRELEPPGPNGPDSAVAPWVSTASALVNDAALAQRCHEVALVWVSTASALVNDAVGEVDRLAQDALRDTGRLVHAEHIQPLLLPAV